MKAIYYTPPIESTYIHAILKEIYQDRVYASLLSGKKDLVIMDVGANIGLTAQFFADYAKTVYAIEPSQIHIDCIKEAIKFNDIKNIKPYKYAVGSENGTMTLNHNANTTMFSLSKAVGQEGEEVEVFTLPALFKKLKVDHVDFMKLDVEGVEMEVIGGEPFLEVADKIDSMLIEYHTWSGRNPGQLVQALTNAGFKVGRMPTDATLFIATKR